MSKQANKDRKPMTRKQNNYGNNDQRSTNPVGEMEGGTMRGPNNTYGRKNNGTTTTRTIWGSKA